MKLIFIHGRAQGGHDPVELQTSWSAALARGLRAAGATLPGGTEVAFPYYGDRLDALVQEVETPLVAEVLTRGGAPDSQEATFRAELLYEMAQGAGISDQEIQQNFAGQPQERGPLNWEWVQAILRALDRTPVGEHTIDRFTRDVYVYLSYRGVRRQIDAIVSEKLPDEPCVVVSHSLGTVVAYNVLAKAAPSCQVKLFVTLGSPLGLKTIKSRIENPLAMPKCAKKWFNAMDDRDVVALYPLNERNFAITPEIENKTDVRNHTDNRHGIDGYLDDPIVARRICDALAG